MRVAEWLAQECITYVHHVPARVRRVAQTRHQLQVPGLARPCSLRASVVRRSGALLQKSSIPQRTRSGTSQTSTRCLADEEGTHRPRQRAPRRFARALEVEQSRVVDMIGASGVGADQLYQHQARAIDAALEGRNVIVTTATASGKSLCFNIPVRALSPRSRHLLMRHSVIQADDVIECLQVLNAVLHPNGAGLDCTTSARALYIYPTKSLAQDQLRALHKVWPAVWVSRACARACFARVPLCLPKNGGCLLSLRSSLVAVSCIIVWRHVLI